METIVIGGTKFSTFIRNGERYLCTGEPSGKVNFLFVGDIFDYYTVEGATSVVHGNETSSLDELYEKWLDHTSFYREVLGIRY